jgi:hypothetical protein
MRRGLTVVGPVAVLGLGLAAALSLAGTGATITAVAESPFTGIVATVTGSCTMNPRVEISWGDGTLPTTGTAQAISGGFTVSGSHGLGVGITRFAEVSSLVGAGISW